MRSIGVELEPIKHILLTHHDVDHIGNAKALQDATGAAVWGQLDFDWLCPGHGQPTQRKGTVEILGTTGR